VVVGEDEEHEEEEEEEEEEEDDDDDDERRNPRPGRRSTRRPFPSTLGGEGQEEADSTLAGLAFSCVRCRRSKVSHKLSGGPRALPSSRRF